MSQYCTAGACDAEPHMNNAFSLLPPPTTGHSRVRVPCTAAQGQQTLPPGAATHTTRGSNAARTVPCYFDLTPSPQPPVSTI